MTTKFFYLPCIVALACMLPMTGCSDDKDAPEPLVPEFVITGCEGVQDFNRGESKTYSVDASNIAQITISAPTGWTADYSDGTLTVTAPSDEERDVTCKGNIVISTMSVDEIEAEAAIEVSTYELRFLTFEDADARFNSFTLSYCNKTISTWSDLIDSKQYGGELLYGSDGYGMDDPYSWYDQNNTELRHSMPPAFSMYCYWSGGHAISNYADTDLSHGDFSHQLSVYGAGGHNGSSNFAMHYGYLDGSQFNMNEGLPAIEFADGKARIIDHMWVMNSTYAMNCYVSGNGLTAKIGPDDWVQIVATGYAADGSKTGESKFYMCNGPDNIVRDWTRWDLSELGKVAKVEFNVTGSSDNGYGFSQPAYFAYDDVAVRFEE